MPVDDLIAADSKSVSWLMAVKLPIDITTMDPLAEGPAGDPENTYGGDGDYIDTVFCITVTGGVGPFRWEITNAVDGGGDPVDAYFKETGTQVIETGGYTECPALRIFGCADTVTVTLEVTDIYTDESITFDKDVSRPTDLEWPEDNPKIVPRGGSVTLYVTGGTLPITWTLDGNDNFYFPGFPDEHTAITTDRNVVLAARYDPSDPEDPETNACGGVTVTATDACSDSVDGGLRTDLGEWDVCQSMMGSGCGSCPDSAEYIDYGAWKIRVLCCGETVSDNGISGATITCSVSGKSITCPCVECAEIFEVYEFIC